ncbi:HVO_A0114 family putative DNA-binding protein [Methanobrevibacter curvatus]|uniref:MarR family protein n=1 Tax=Methanobrevibacter curvatus TaxID=49547 RepID=A0A165Z1Y2_9EURY|nr:MarR family transcriptional regulator [Methanobrevibacter curvatus]KZX10144.1 MarR family protein [Methanobrevibacter curvatus]
MIMINLVRNIEAKEIIKELEKKYSTIKHLKTIIKQEKNMKLEFDLEQWEYALENPEEIIKDGKVLISDNINIGKTELEIINFIKNKKPKSINELASLLNKDNSTMQRKVKQLEQEGLLDLKDGVKNSKIPVVNYDKIEIAI